MIRLVVSDVDGTLVTGDKVLTDAAIAAARRLREAGVLLALVSSRPPRGMRMMAEPLGIDTPMAGFNGGEIRAPDGTVLHSRLVPETAWRATLDLLARENIGAWVFADDKWLLRDPEGDYVGRERHTVQFEPEVVHDLAGYAPRAGKVVGASRDFDLLARCEGVLHEQLGTGASVHRSQPYYLDVTHPEANKGHALLAIAKLLGIDPAETAAIGDMGNDVPMFAVAGFSVAMGNGPPEVRARATAVTGGNEADGWAQAIDTLILPRIGKAA